MTDDGGATAFAPGHVTGFFSVHRREDAPRTGSRGAGVALSDGVTATVADADESTVRLNGDARRIESVARVLDALGVTATVDCETPLPVGAGFGVSGAAALAAALAANAAFDAGRLENDLVRIAHVAEVRSNTGLGDVVGQARGGVPVRLEPGAPPHARLDGVPGSARVEYLSLGELSTAEVVGGDTTALSRAGETALADLRERPTLPRLMSVSRRFARESGLVTADVEAVIDDVDAAGGTAAMAMLGRSVVSLDAGLSAAGYDPAVCRIDAAGAGVGSTE